MSSMRRKTFPWLIAAALMSLAVTACDDDDGGGSYLLRGAPARCGAGRAVCRRRRGRDRDQPRPRAPRTAVTSADVTAGVDKTYNIMGAASHDQTARPRGPRAVLRHDRARAPAARRDARAASRATQLLELLPELDKCLDRKAGVLSGGEQQMLAVGRALVSAPRLLLVDEMSLGLAPVIVERLLPILRRVAERHRRGRAVRRAARLARARGRRPRLRAQPRTARARGRRRRPARAARAPALQLLGEAAVSHHLP